MNESVAIDDGRSAHVNALHEYAILDSDPEPRFDAITKILSLALELPIAWISLVDADREWVKAAYGVEASSLPCELGFAASATAAGELLVIEDAAADPRFAAHPLVTGPHQLRFFAGVALEVQGGHRLGALCVLGTQPRTLVPREAELLRTLGQQAVELIELRHTETELASAMQRIRTLATLIPICSHCRKVRDDENHWSTLERLVQAKTGSRFTHGICPECVREHYPDAADELLRLGK